GARYAAMPERIGNVLLDRHMRPDRVGLEHHTDVARARRYLNAVGRRRHHAPAHTHAPGRGMLESGDAAPRRGLAAVGGTEQHYDLAGRHVKADPIHGGPTRGELLAQIADVEGGRHARLRDVTPAASAPYCR